MRRISLLSMGCALGLSLGACSETESNLADQNQALVKKAQLLSLAKQSGCFSCHAIDRTVIGPSWIDIAKKYQPDSNTRARLIESIKNGSKGTWGKNSMPANSPQVPDADIETLVDYILSLNGTSE